MFTFLSNFPYVITKGVITKGVNTAILNYIHYHRQLPSRLLQLYSLPQTTTLTTVTALSKYIISSQGVVIATITEATNRNSDECTISSCHIRNREYPQQQRFTDNLSSCYISNNEHSLQQRRKDALLIASQWPRVTKKKRN